MKGRPKARLGSRGLEVPVGGRWAGWQDEAVEAEAQGFYFPSSVWTSEPRRADASTLWSQGGLLESGELGGWSPSAIRPKHQPRAG